MASSCGSDSVRAFPRHGLLFEYSTSTARGLQTINAALYLRQPGSRPVRLTSPSLLTDDPAWSPNGKQIAFTMTGPCNAGSDPECAIFPEVFVTNGTGGSPRQLTFSAKNVLRSVTPSWSPDGRRIVFQRQFDNYARLAIASVGGKKIRVLAVAGSDPAWGRAGIAYLAQRRSHRADVPLLDPAT